MDFKGLEKFLKDNNYLAFRSKQIKKAVFQDGIIYLRDISVLPKDLRELLDDKFKILPFQIKSISESKDKKSFKALLELSDKKIIETVLLNMKTGFWSVCVSSQAGCAMRCSFCATGAAGFFRNLTPDEIWEQVLFWKNFIAKNKISSHAAFYNSKISNVVYMGMGEPFNNIDNVFESIKVLVDPDMFGLGQRSISVSTCGILTGIEKFAEEFPQVNLAISLHAANDKLRSEIMPVNKTYNLQKLAESLKNYFKKANRKIFIEYILLDGVNDSPKNAKDLVEYLRSIGHTHLLHINLIIFNKIAGSLFNSSSRARAVEFEKYLIKSGFNATIRKSLGQDIEGACGQLAGKKVVSSS